MDNLGIAVRKSTEKIIVKIRGQRRDELQLVLGAQAAMTNGKTLRVHAEWAGKKQSPKSGF